MRTAIRGNISESAVLHALVRRGFHVLLPFGDGCPYDLVVGLDDGVLIRVQVKTGRVRQPGSVTFNAYSTDHGRGPGSYLGLADVFGVYFPPRDSVYLVPVLETGRTEVSLRFAPPRNNQRRRVRQARDYLIENWTTDALRAVARGEPDAIAA
ncbi:hypothetical protein BH10ACT11_BH10ACT11_19360 [soil metagenome]